MDVSVIIVNYNTCQMTSECIDSIFEKTSGIKFEVILVDNASTDGSKEHFEKDGRIKYIYSSENLGFGKANNLGYEYSCGRYIFLLNSDTFLINNAIKILSDFLDSHGNVAIAGGQLYNKDMNRVHSFRYIYPSILSELDMFLHFTIYRLIEKCKNREINKNGFTKVAYITGADMILRKEDIEKYGFFDPDFFMYFEETELSYRYKRKKLYSYFYPQAKIVHLENISFKGNRVRSEIFLQSRKLYFKKTHSKIYQSLVDILYMMTCVSRMLLYAFNTTKFNIWRIRYKDFNKANL